MATDKNPSTSANDEQRDDLRIISGIGPRFTAALHEIGVHRFADLAQYTPEDLAAALVEQASLRVSPRLIDSQNWIGQAHLLSEPKFGKRSSSHDVEGNPVQADLAGSQGTSTDLQWQAVSNDQNTSTESNRTRWQTIRRWFGRVFGAQNK